MVVGIERPFFSFYSKFSQIKMTCYGFVDGISNKVVSKVCTKELCFKAFAAINPVYGFVIFKWQLRLYTGEV